MSRMLELAEGSNAFKAARTAAIATFIIVVLFGLWAGFFEAVGFIYDRWGMGALAAFGVAFVFCLIWLFVWLNLSVSQSASSIRASQEGEG